VHQRVARLQITSSLARIVGDSSAPSPSYVESDYCGYCLRGGGCHLATDITNGGCSAFHIDCYIKCSDTGGCHAV
jgi:hypothetical protein